MFECKCSQCNLVEFYLHSELAVFVHVGVYTVQHVGRLRLKSCFQRRDQSTNWPKNLKKPFLPNLPGSFLSCVTINSLSGEKVQNKRNINT